MKEIKFEIKNFLLTYLTTPFRLQTSPVIISGMSVGAFATIWTAILHSGIRFA